MTLFVRPLITCLLAGVAVLGHAPVWLHLAGCEHDHLVNELAGSGANDCNFDCCQHSPSGGDQSANSNSSQEPSGSDGDHHSESCVLCQTLGVPVGVAWDSGLPLIVRLDLGIAKIPTLTVPEPTPRSIPRPRGPPTPLA
jgi:hypothetical protein